jgi:hypothetical protein
MSSYYNIFKDTEFITQNTDSKNTYKLLKKIYQQGGNMNDLIYEDIDTDADISKLKLSKTNSDSNSNKFINSCKQSKVQNFKQPIIQIGGFYIQL